MASKRRSFISLIFIINCITKCSLILEINTNLEKLTVRLGVEMICIFLHNISSGTTDFFREVTRKNREKTLQFKVYKWATLQFE